MAEDATTADGELAVASAGELVLPCSEQTVNYARRENVLGKTRGSSYKKCLPSSKRIANEALIASYERIVALKGVKQPIGKNMRALAKLKAVGSDVQEVMGDVQEVMGDVKEVKDDVKEVKDDVKEVLGIMKSKCTDAIANAVAKAVAKDKISKCKAAFKALEKGEKDVTKAHGAFKTAMLMEGALSTKTKKFVAQIYDVTFEFLGNATNFIDAHGDVAEWSRGITLKRDQVAMLWEDARVSFDNARIESLDLDA